MTTTSPPGGTVAPPAVVGLTWDGVVDLAQVLTYVRPAYGGDTFADAIPALLAIASERETVEVLRATVGPDGLFDEPALIRFDDEDGTWYVGNGMHRITATYLAGHNRIRCTSEPNTGSGDDTELVQLYLDVDAACWPDDSDDDLDYLTGWMRSFRLPDGTWVEMLGGGMFSGQLEFEWYCAHADADALVESVTARAARHDVTVTVSRVRRTTIGELFADD